MKITAATPFNTEQSLFQTTGQILSSPLATSLPTLPFTVLVTLFDSTPLTTDDGVLLRRMTLEIGAIHLVLACLSVLSHHGPRGASQPATAEGGGGPSVSYYKQMIMCVLLVLDVQ